MTILERQAPYLFGSGRLPQPARPLVRPPQPRRTLAVPRAPRFPMRPSTTIDGEVVQWLPIGDLAKAIGRSVGHVRLLEKQGVLPPAQARRRVRGHRGWRLYRGDFVAAVAVIAAEERITSRKAVMDLSRFRERVWAAHQGTRT